LNGRGPGESRGLSLSRPEKGLAGALRVHWKVVDANTLYLLLFTYMPRFAVQSAAPPVQTGEERTKVLLSGQKAAQLCSTKTPLW
jgi:hypothetical protein